MPLYTHARDLLTHDSATELASIASPDNTVVDATLMQLTIEGGDRSSYDSSAIEAADRALDRINDRLDDAEAQVDGYLLEAGYSTPLAFVPRDIRVYTTHIARWLLWSKRSAERVEAFYAEAIRELKRIGAGKRPLLNDEGVELAKNTVPSDRPAYSTPARAFTHDTLSDFR